MRSFSFVAPSGDVLVRQVMNHLGCRSPIDLAEAMGWKRGTERLIAKWLAGNNNPGYEKTMEMLERCGWLSLNGGGHADATIPRDRLAELEATVETQGRATTQALEALTRGIRKLERQLTAEAAPTKQGRVNR